MPHEESKISDFKFLKKEISVFLLLIILSVNFIFFLTSESNAKKFFENQISYSKVIQNFQQKYFYYTPIFL